MAGRAPHGPKKSNDYCAGCDGIGQTAKFSLLLFFCQHVSVNMFLSNASDKDWNRTYSGSPLEHSECDQQRGKLNDNAKKYQEQPVTKAIKESTE